MIEMLCTAGETVPLNGGITSTAGESQEPAGQVQAASRNHPVLITPLDQWGGSR